MPAISTRNLHALPTPSTWQGCSNRLPHSTRSCRPNGMAGTTRSTRNGRSTNRWATDASWQHGPVEFPEGDDPDGSKSLLAILDGDPSGYQEFADEYYEMSVPLDAVRQIYGHAPLTDALAKSLNPNVSLKDLTDDLGEIGYPQQKAT